MPFKATLQGRLRDLGEHFGDLSARVRDAVAEAVGETLARIARDTVSGIVHGRPVSPIRRPTVYVPEQDFDPWADPDPWVEPSYHSTDYPEVLTPGTPAGKHPSLVALTAGLGTAGWWLRRGSLPGAVVAGVVAGVLALFTRRDTAQALELMEGVRALIGLQRGLNAGADTLARR